MRSAAPPPGAPAASPTVSPIRTSPRPHTRAIRPAAADGAGTSLPRSKTLSAVTRPSPTPAPSLRTGGRSLTRRVPEVSRTYAIRSPAGPRSILKTLPDSGPPGSPPEDGSSSAMPSISASTPAPVTAEPA